MICPCVHPVPDDDDYASRDARVRDARCARLYHDAEQRLAQRQAITELTHLVEYRAADEAACCASVPSHHPSATSPRATSLTAAAPVFSRLYMDAQRYNQAREARERALREKQQRERAMLESERAHDLAANHVVTSPSVIASGADPHSRSRSPRRASSASTPRKGADGRGTSVKSCCSNTLERPCVMQQLFERLSQPLHTKRKHVDLAREVKNAQEAAQRQREEEQRRELNVLLQYNWNVPAPRLSISDLRDLNEQIQC